MSSLGQRRSFVRPLIPHLAWEGVLFVVLLFVVILARLAEPGLFRAGVVWTQWATIGLFASAVALSLRMAVPNLAIPALAAVGGVWFVDRVNGGTNVAVAAIAAIVLCLVVGLLLGAFVGLTGVPAWAASLAVLALLQAYLIAHSEGRVTPLRGAAFSANFTWFLVFAFLSILGAAALAAPAVRARFGPAGPARLSARLVTSLIGLGGSSAAAGLAGVLMARRIQASQVSLPFDLFLIGLGVALIAGVSVYGGQGPIFGVVLASGIVAVVVLWSVLAGLAVWSQLVVAGIVIPIGLLVGGVIALISRRLTVR